MSNFLHVIRAQQKQIRKDFKVLARMFPGAFDKHGRPIVAAARFP